MSRLLIVAMLHIGAEDFERLLERLRDAWNRGDAREAADCFAEDAVSIEPPDRQLYRGRAELYRFFGGESGRPGRWAQIDGGLIRRWREYQYASELEWDAFIGGLPR